MFVKSICAEKKKKKEEKEEKKNKIKDNKLQLGQLLFICFGKRRKERKIG